MSDPQPSLAQRLGQVQVGMRPALEFSRHLFHGEPCYVCLDPLTFRSSSFSNEDYQLITSFDDSRSLAENFSQLVEQELLDETQEEQYYQFVLQLNQQGFLNLPIADGKALYERFAKRRSRERRSKIMGILFFKMSLFSPDRFLDRSMRYFSWMFSRTAFFVWCCLLAIAAGIIAKRWSDLGNPLNALLATQNLIFTYLSFIGLKVIHEFGHAYACKHYGGHVPEMGAFFMVGTPCAYVDASAAWGFPSRWHRIVVSLAGIYFESFAAFAALLIWNATPPGPLNSFAYQTMMLAGMITVVVNINPLMRYDGYYIASDILGVPNLRARATQYVQNVFKRQVLRLECPETPSPLYLRAILLAYGVCGSVYKVVLTLSICGMIAMKLFVVGMLVGCVYATVTAYGCASKLVRYLCYSTETAPVRYRAVSIAALLLIVIPIGVACIPLPLPIESVAVLATDKDDYLFARSSGFLRQVNYRPGDTVRAGETLFSLESTEAETIAQNAAAELEWLKLRYRGEATHSPAMSMLTVEQIKHSKRTLDKALREVDELNIIAPTEGKLLQPGLEPYPGQFIQAGQLVAAISSGKWIVRTLLTAEQFSDIDPVVGEPVTMRMLGESQHKLLGRINLVNPYGSQTIHIPALTHLAGGSIAVDPEEMTAEQAFFEIQIEPIDLNHVSLQHGMRLAVRFDGPCKPLGYRIYRSFLQFFNRLKFQ